MERYIGLDVHAASCTLAVVSEKGRKLRDFPVETNGPALVDALLCDLAQADDIEDGADPHSDTGQDEERAQGIRSQALKGDPQVFPQGHAAYPRRSRLLPRPKVRVPRTRASRRSFSVLSRETMGIPRTSPSSRPSRTSILRSLVSPVRISRGT